MRIFSASPRATLAAADNKIRTLQKPTIARTVLLLPWGLFYVQWVAFIFLGLYLIVGVIPRAVQMLEHLYMERQLSLSLRPAFQASIVPEIAGMVVQLAPGLGLLFRASELVEWLHSFRSGKTTQ